MVLPAIIEKKEPAKIHRVETLPEPELQFTSSMVVEFEETETESDSYELVVTGSTMEVIESIPEPDPRPEPSEPPAIYNDPFFNAYFKR